MTLNRRPKLVAGAAAEEGCPLSATDFSDLMEPFAPLFSSNANWAVAVSGGPDSMALVHLMAGWQQKKPGRAFIVDHGLRKNSCIEAEDTRSSLEKRGIAAEILRWEHAPIEGRLHELARNARFDLLLNACRQKHVGILLLAHHRGDQAETVLMRLAKGSGVDGLSGMKRQSLRDGIHLLRPLLSLAKNRLIATCRDANISYVIDPSNSSPLYARGRLRTILPLLEKEGLSESSLILLAKRAAMAKEALDYAALGLLRLATEEDPSGSLTGDLEQFRSAPFEIARRALGTMLQHVHATPHPPKGTSIELILEKLRADNPMSPTTLFGSQVTKGVHRFVVTRLYTMIDGYKEIRPGETQIFDQRWRVSLSSTASSAFLLAPLKCYARKEIDLLSPNLRKRIPRGLARATLPALFHDDGSLASIPSFDEDNSSAARATLIKPWPSAALPSPIALI